MLFLLCTLDESRGLRHRQCHERFALHEATRTSSAWPRPSSPCVATSVASWSSNQESILRVCICLAVFRDMIQTSDAFSNGADSTIVLFFLLRVHHRCVFSATNVRPTITLVRELCLHHEASESNAGVCSKPVRRKLLRSNAARMHSSRRVEAHVISFRCFAAGTPTLHTCCR